MLIFVHVRAPPFPTLEPTPCTHAYEVCKEMASKKYGKQIKLQYLTLSVTCT